MELILTGRQFGADDAERWGVVSRVIREEKADGEEHLPVVKEALDVASKIAGFGQLAVQAAKEAVNAGGCILCQNLLLDLSPTVPQLSICPFLKDLDSNVAYFIVYSRQTTRRKVCARTTVRHPSTSRSRTPPTRRNGRICREAQSQFYALLGCGLCGVG